MNLTAKYLSFFLIGLMLMGNIGVSLTTVLCHCTGKELRSFSPPASPCCQHKAQLAQNNPPKHCCRKTNTCPAPSTNQIQLNSTCCTQTTDYQHITVAHKPNQPSIKACVCAHCHDAWLPALPIAWALAAPAYTYAPLVADTFFKSARSNAPPLRPHAHARALLNNIKNYRC